MSISRSKPEGWAFAEPLTSEQLNNLDTNSTNSLDKRSGQTDTLASDVTVTGALTVNNNITLTEDLIFITGAQIAGDVKSIVDIKFDGTTKPSFVSPRTYIRPIALNPIYNKLTAGVYDWEYNLTAAGFVNVPGNAVVVFNVPHWEGATLVSATVYYQIIASGPPGTSTTGLRAQSNVLEFSTGDGATSGFTYAPNAGSGSYDAGGATQSFSVPFAEVMAYNKNYSLIITSDHRAASCVVYGVSATYGVNNLDHK